MSIRLSVLWMSGGDATRVEVDAYPTPVDGLVIHAHYNRPGVWIVNHAPSGAAVLHLPDPEAALYAAVRLGQLADWTLPGQALRATPGLWSKIRALARELGCLELSLSGRVVPDADLAQTEAAS